MTSYLEKAIIHGTKSAFSKKALNSLKKTSKLANIPKAPLKLKKVLDQFKLFDVTPMIKIFFSNTSLVDWFKAFNSDKLIKNLTITDLGSPTSF